MKNISERLYVGSNSLIPTGQIKDSDIFCYRYIISPKELKKKYAPLGAICR